MTQASAALKRAGRVRATRQAVKAIEAAGHAADLLAWRQERAERIRAAEQARAERIAQREAAIEDGTVAYLLAAQAKESIMAEALARCAEHDQAAATAVAGLRQAGLTRADIAQITGASAREVAGLLGGANSGDGPGDADDVHGEPADGSAEDVDAVEGGRQVVDVTGTAAVRRAGATADVSTGPLAGPAGQRQLVIAVGA